MAFIYVMTNRATPDWVKVGMTKRSVQERRAELSSGAGVIYPYAVVSYWQVGDDHVAQAEVAAHAALSDCERGVNNNGRPNENFYCDKVKAVEIVQHALRKFNVHQSVIAGIKQELEAARVQQEEKKWSLNILEEENIEELEGYDCRVDYPKDARKAVEEDISRENQKDKFDEFKGMLIIGTVIAAVLCLMDPSHFKLFSSIFLSYCALIFLRWLITENPEPSETHIVHVLRKADKIRKEMIERHQNQERTLTEEVEKSDRQVDSLEFKLSRAKSQRVYGDNLSIRGGNRAHYGRRQW